MAQKKITDLALISSVTGTLSMVGDNGIATYRFTPAQLWTYLRTLYGALTAISAAGTSLTQTTSTVMLTPAANFTQMLPAIAGITDGTEITLKNCSATYTVTVDANASETIDGSLTVDLLPLESITVVKNSSGWWII
jgi:hypothetical protein